MSHVAKALVRSRDTLGNARAFADIFGLNDPTDGAFERLSLVKGWQRPRRQ